MAGRVMGARTPGPLLWGNELACQSCGVRAAQVTSLERCPHLLPYRGDPVSFQEEPGRGQGQRS